MAVNRRARVERGEGNGPAPARPEPAAESKDGAPGPAAPGERLYLAGRPTLHGFIRQVRDHALSPPSKGDLVEQWRAARDRLRVLERVEAGLADGPPFLPLGAAYEPLLVEFLRDPVVRHSFNTVPCDIVLVELDRLVVFQKHIDLTFARQLARRLGPSPDPEQVFRTCLPTGREQPPVRWSAVRRNTYAFVSHSNDLRFLGASALRPDQLGGAFRRGAPAGVVGLAVGFGSNLLNAVYAENRLILNNGSHRAFALRELGVTHVPCVVQHVTCREELEVVGSAHVRKHPDLFLAHPRPAMLRDYFDPALRTVFPCHRRLRQVTVRFTVEETSLPAP